jgi:hypothetical protein
MEGKVMCLRNISFLFVMSLSSLLSGATLFHDTFEDGLCGKFPNEWGISAWERKGEYKELCRYVSNVESLGGEKSLVYDFSQMPIVTKSGKYPHGYTARKFPVVKDGWACLSFCFKKEIGSLAVEIRGQHKNGNQIKIPWWIKIGDLLTLKSAGSGRNEFANAGSIRPKIWYRANFKLPTLEGKQNVAKVRLDRYLGNGKFENGEWKDAPIGKMELTQPYSHFDFTGYGQSKYFIDDVIFAEIKE